MIEDAVEKNDVLRMSALIESNKKMLKELQNKSFDLRMNSLKSLFQRIHRAAIQICNQQNKKINFIFEGDDVELDRSIIDEIGEALTHMIRNAVDHGIESDETRAANNKKYIAEIKVIARQESDRVQIEITDNGKGLDPDALKRKALEKDLFDQHQLEQMSDQDSYMMIFSSGFSTAEKVNDVSGRGVGMSAVKETVESLSGDLRIESKVGFGTSFFIDLPTSVSIIDGIQLETSEQSIVLPLRKIKEVVAFDEVQLDSNVKGLQLANFRGQNLNILQLDSIIDLKHSKNDPKICFIIEKNSQLLGILASGKITQKQVVVKGLGDKLSEFDYYNGLTILGNGEPAFILDIYKVYEEFYKGDRKWKQAS